MGKGQTVECLLHIFKTACENPSESGDPLPLPATIAKLVSKVMFALKQLCVDAPKTKEGVGGQIIQRILKDLRCRENLEHRDWVTNAIMLLLLLAANETNVRLIREAGWDETYKILAQSMWHASDVTRERIQQLENRISCFAQTPA